MAWKCKECGGEVKLWSYTTYAHYFVSPIDKDGDYTVDEEKDAIGIKQIDYFDSTSYDCQKCGQRSNQLENIAIWEDE